MSPTESAQRGLASIALALASLSLAIPAGADVTESEVSDAREVARAIAASLDAEQERLDAASEALWALEDRMSALEADIRLADIRLRANEIDLDDRIAQVYMRGDRERAGLVLQGGGLEVLTMRLVYANAVVDDDLERIRSIGASQAERQRLGEELDLMFEMQSQLLEETSARTEVIIGELNEANDSYLKVKAEWDQQEEERRRREEEARRREEAARQRLEAAALATATEPTTSEPVTVAPGGKTCPVDGAMTFRDTWGAPRPGGRTHKGTDLSAALGTPLVAIESGRIVQLSNHVAGGLGLYLQGSESRLVYYYAHLSGFAPGIAGGSTVAKGQVVGWVGTTGNATAPNLHLGLMPGSLDLSRLQNPYGLLVDLCR